MSGWEFARRGKMIEGFSRVGLQYMEKSGIVK